MRLEAPVAERTVSLATRPHLLSNARVDLEMPEGLTLGEMLDRSGIDPYLAPWCRVTLNGAVIPPTWWDRVRPKVGAMVAVCVVPCHPSCGRGSLRWCARPVPP